MTKTIILKMPAIKHRADMEMLVREITALKLTEKLLVATMDAEIQSVRDEYAGRLERVTGQLAIKTAAARDWAQKHPAAFGNRKSIEFTHATVGFRTGPPKLKLAPKSRWDQMLEILRGTDWGKNYIRVKAEINKEQIIADVAAKNLSAAELRKAGAEVVQQELFYVEPKFHQVEPREVAPG
jgi:phage host-nuclease inhibitor protein Gam